MFQATILPIFSSTGLCDTACGIMHPVYNTSCITQFSAPEDGQNGCLKHVELIRIINKQLLLHLVGYLFYTLYKKLLKMLTYGWLIFVLVRNKHDLPFSTQ
jgi:hypothetical protein